jgi:hypothetical protein
MIELLGVFYAIVGVTGYSMYFYHNTGDRKH